MIVRSLTILVRRRKEGEKSPGKLEAWVIQVFSDGIHKGENLLRGESLFEIERAKARALYVLWRDVRFEGDVAWQIEDWNWVKPTSQGSYGRKQQENYAPYPTKKSDDDDIPF